MPHLVKPTSQPVAPFSITFSLILALFSTFLIPLILFIGLIAVKKSTSSFANIIPITADNFGLYVLAVQSISLIIILAVIMRKKKKQALPWSAIGFKKFNSWQAVRYILGYFLLLAAALTAVALVVFSIAPDLSPSANDESGGTRVVTLMGGIWPAFVLSVILAPIIEEIVFRGIMFPALRKHYGVIVGIIASSLVFTLVHINILQMISALPLGIYLAIMYHRTGSIIPGIVLHALWNLIVLLITFI